jgi:lysophospholipase
VIREATALSSDETLWLSRRDDATIPALEQFLTRVDIGGIDIQAYLDGIVRNGTALPRIGIAVSGGGYRAMINGAGAIAAFDNRTTGSTDKGHLGGILQAATYLSGLSGGSWVVGSLYVQNFTTVESIIYGSNSFLDSLWQLDDSIFEGLWAQPFTWDLAYCSMIQARQTSQEQNTIASYIKMSKAKLRRGTTSL